MNSHKIYLIILLLVLSCESKIERQTFINVDEASEKQIESLFKYTYPVKRKYFNNDKAKTDSFKPVIFSYVKSLEEDKYPQRIFGIGSRMQKSTLDYFQNDLRGKNVSYLKKDSRIIFRYYYHEYKFSSLKTDIERPKNKEEIINFLKENKIKYKLLKSIKAGNGDLVNLKINNKFIQITATSSFCKSLICYDLKDSINVQNYGLIVESFFY